MQSGSADSKKIGEILVEEGLITQSQLERALEEQRRRPSYKPLGEVCRELGLISHRNLRHVLLKYRKQLRLGDLLVKLGLVTDEQVRESLNVQAGARKKLGEILVEKGFLSRSALADSLSLQLSVDKIDPTSRRVDRNLLQAVNTAFLKKKRAIPLFYDRSKNLLTVIMEDPSDSDTIADLEKIFRANVEPVILSSGTVEALMSEVFDVWYSAF